MNCEASSGAAMRFTRCASLIAIALLLSAFPLKAEPPGAGANPVAQRYDSYKNFKYLVISDGHVVAGFGKFTGLWVGAPDHRSSSTPPPLGLVASILDQGSTYDADFTDWATQVSQLHKQSGDDIAIANLRRDIDLEYVNEKGAVVTYHLKRSWVSEYRSTPNLAVSGTNIPIEHIKIEHELVPFP